MRAEDKQSYLKKLFDGQIYHKRCWLDREYEQKRKGGIRAMCEIKRVENEVKILLECKKILGVG